MNVVCGLQKKRSCWLKITGSCACPTLARFVLIVFFVVSLLVVKLFSFENQIYDEFYIARDAFTPVVRKHREAFPDGSISRVFCETVEKLVDTQHYQCFFLNRDSPGAGLLVNTEAVLILRWEILPFVFVFAFSSSSHPLFFSYSFPSINNILVELQISGIRSLNAVLIPPIFHDYLFKKMATALRSSLALESAPPEDPNGGHFVIPRLTLVEACYVFVVSLCVMKVCHIFLEPETPGKTNKKSGSNTTSWVWKMFMRMNPLAQGSPHNAKKSHHNNKRPAAATAVQQQPSEEITTPPPPRPIPQAQSPNPQKKATTASKSSQLPPSAPAPTPAHSRRAAAAKTQPRPLCKGETHFRVCDPAIPRTLQWTIFLEEETFVTASITSFGKYSGEMFYNTITAAPRKVPTTTLPNTTALRPPSAEHERRRSDPLCAHSHSHTSAGGSGARRQKSFDLSALTTRNEFFTAPLLPPKPFAPISSYDRVYVKELLSTKLWLSGAEDDSTKPVRLFCCACASSGHLVQDCPTLSSSTRH